jgi:hypothetical protein
MILLGTNVVNRNERANEKNLRLGSRTDTRDRETDVDCRTNTTEKEFSLQEDLTVRNGNDLVEGEMLGKEGTRAGD